MQLKRWLKWLPRPVYEGLLQGGKQIRRRVFDISDPMSDLMRLGSVRPPDVLLDIGAHHGQTAKELRRCFPTTPIHSFEPFAESFAILEDATKALPSMFAHPYALGDQCCTAQFFSNRNSQTNSLLEIDSASKTMGAATENVGTVDVQVRTLDSIAAKHFPNQRMFIKADVQGAELMLIEGAKQCLMENTDVFYTEVSLSPLYKGQGDLFSIHYALTTHFPLELYQIYRTRSNRDGKALWADAMWIRKDFFDASSKLVN